MKYEPMAGDRFDHPDGRVLQVDTVIDGYVAYAYYTNGVSTIMDMFGAPIPEFIALAEQHVASGNGKLYRYSDGDWREVEIEAPEREGVTR
jgi:hypothetical protein